MRKQESVTLGELARLVGGRLNGEGSIEIRGVSGIRDAQPGEITFLANRRYSPLLSTTHASAVIIGDGVHSPIPAISVHNPDLAFARVAEHFAGDPIRPPPGVHPTAVVSSGASVGRNASIGAYVVIEDGASIGERAILYPLVYVGHGARIGPDTLVYPNVVVRERCRVGARVILHSGAIIGSDGFGFTPEEGANQKIPQTGVVVIEDDVEIGANVVIARARFDRTIVQKGTKIDSLVQIAHNVVLGEGTLIAAQAGIAGSTRVGRHVMIGGQAGITGHVEIGDRAVVAGQAAVTKNVPASRIVAGTHADDLKVHLRQLAALARLPGALAELKQLKKDIQELRKKVKA